MLYKSIWVWLAIQIPLGVFFGLMLRAGRRVDWVEQNAKLDVQTVAAAETVVEQGAG